MPDLDGQSDYEEPQSQAVLAFLATGLHQVPSRALAVTALADSRRAVTPACHAVSPRPHGSLPTTRMGGIRENAAALAVMEVTPHRINDDPSLFADALRDSAS